MFKFRTDKPVLRTNTITQNFWLWRLGAIRHEGGLGMKHVEAAIHKPFISIIIGVYNKQDTISKLLETLSSDSCNHEVILVDDHSTDNSHKIVSNHCDQSPHFKYIQLDENIGAGGARNAGAKLAQGKYLCFFDADDDCNLNALLSLQEQLAHCGYPDVAITNYDRCFFQQKTLSYQFHPNYLGIHSGYDALILRLNKVICPSPWNKVYKREYWEKNRFIWPSMRHSEDIAVITDFIGRANKVLISDINYYTYNVNNNSITRSLSADKIKHVMQALHHMHHTTLRIPNANKIDELNNKLFRCAYAHMKYFLKINIEHMSKIEIHELCESIMQYNRRYKVPHTFFIREFDGYKLLKIIRKKIRKEKLNINLLKQFSASQRLLIMLMQFSPIKIGLWKKRKPSRFLS